MFFSRLVGLLLISFQISSFGLGDCRSLLNSRSLESKLRWSRVHRGERVEYRLVTDPRERQECFELLKQVMLSRYGLESWENLSSDYKDNEHLHVYFSARDSNGNLLSTVRLIPNFDAELFDNFYPGIKENWPYQIGEVYTYGAYHRDQNLPIRSKTLNNLFQMSFAYIRAKGGKAIYAEANGPALGYIQTFGHQIISDPFLPKGWTREYQATILDFRRVEEALEEPVTRLRYEETVGRRVNWKLIRQIFDKNPD